MIIYPKLVKNFVTIVKEHRIIVLNVIQMEQIERIYQILCENALAKKVSIKMKLFEIISVLVRKIFEKNVY